MPFYSNNSEAGTTTRRSNSATRSLKVISNSRAAAKWSLDHEVILPLVSPIRQLIFWPFPSHLTLSISAINYDYDAILLPEGTTYILPGKIPLRLYICGLNLFNCDEFFQEIESLSVVLVRLHLIWSNKLSRSRELLCILLNMLLK